MESKRPGTRRPTPASDRVGLPTSGDEQLRFLAESMPQMIFTSLADGRTDYMNQQWAEFSGITLDQLRDAGRSQIVHPDDAKETLRQWKRVLKTGKTFSIEHRLRRHDGEYRWHITRARAMRDIQGHIIKWFGSSTDIHDSKMALQRAHQMSVRALTLTKQREELLERNAFKDEFISLASHQLRTPATVVKQYLHLILDGYVGTLSPALEEMVRRANTSNERQIEIVDDLLRVARLDAGKVKLARKRTNIVPLVNEVLNEHLSIFEERQQTTTITYTKPGISAVIDPSRIKMVIENLVDNASKYSPHGTHILIIVEKKKNAVCISVKDEGVGIEKKDLPKLFRKFSRLPNALSISVGGTGLGLYWAKRIVELHGGSITVRSTKTKGSTFTVTLLASASK